MHPYLDFSLICLRPIYLGLLLLSCLDLTFRMLVGLNLDYFFSFFFWLRGDVHVLLAALYDNERFLLYLNYVSWTWKS
jgi:hypothetical protein